MKTPTKFQLDPSNSSKVTAKFVLSATPPDEGRCRCRHGEQGQDDMEEGWQYRVGDRPQGHFRGSLSNVVDGLSSTATDTSTLASNGYETNEARTTESERIAESGDRRDSGVGLTLTRPSFRFLHRFIRE
jgi:hypothetical protein